MIKISFRSIWWLNRRRTKLQIATTSPSFLVDSSIWDSPVDRQATNMVGCLVGKTPFRRSSIRATGNLTQWIYYQTVKDYNVTYSQSRQPFEVCLCRTDDSTKKPGPSACDAEHLACIFDHQAKSCSVAHEGNTWSHGLLTLGCEKSARVVGSLLSGIS